MFSKKNTALIALCLTAAVFPGCSKEPAQVQSDTAPTETEQETQPSRKILRNGQVLILRNGVAYDMMGNTL